MWPFKSYSKFLEMDFRTDIHCHLLPGVDDGFKSEDKSVKALELLHATGLEHSFLTPHIFPELYPENTPENIRTAYSEISDKFSAAGVETYPAGEHMIYQGIEKLFGRDSVGTCLTLPGDRILVEMSYAYESQNIRDFVFHLNAVGLHPVLAHPERYSYYSRSLVEIRSIVDIDTSLQLNILSLGGFYGNTAKVKAEAILEAGLYTYLGTDLHSLAQIEQLQSLRIEKKHVAAIEKLLENNDMLWKAGAGA